MSTERLEQELRIARFDAEVPVRELREEIERLRRAGALHARTLDDRALGHSEHVARDRDSIDNELYNAVRVADPAWWDNEVPGLNGDPDCGGSGDACNKAGWIDESQAALDVLKRDA